MRLEISTYFWMYGGSNPQVVLPHTLRKGKENKELKRKMYKAYLCRRHSQKGKLILPC